MSVKVKAPKSSRSVGMAIGCMVFIWELSESEPIEDVSKITFIISKPKGRAALRDKLSLRGRDITDNYLPVM